MAGYTHGRSEWTNRRDCLDRARVPSTHPPIPHPAKGRYIPVKTVQPPEDTNDATPVLDAAGAANLLRVSSKTVLRLARSGEIPGRKIGREWRFAREALMEHLTKAVVE